MGIQTSYNSSLVILSIFVAIFASYVALDITLRMAEAKGKTALAWLVTGASTMGLGIWSMHFVGMLALNMHGMTMSYDVLLSVLSIFVAIGASGLAFFIIHSPNIQRFTIFFGSITMAVAIAGMHYLGMYSMRMSAVTVWSPGLIAFSIVIALVASYMALTVAIKLKTARHPLPLHIIASLLLGAAVYGMHYVGMEAAAFVHTNEQPSMEGLVIASETLAWSVGGAALLILLVAFISSAVDRIFVRRERQSQEEISRREAQLREAQTLAQIGSWEWYLKEDHAVYSDEFLRMFDLPKTFSFQDIDLFYQKIIPSDAQKLKNAIKKAATEESYFNVTYRVFTGKGNERIVEGRARVVKNENGEAYKMVGTTQDITHLKKIEAELLRSQAELENRVKERTAELNESYQSEKAAREAAQAATVVKSQFLANMSHEIRTPMNSILGFAELLGMGGLTPEQRDYIDRIRTNGSQLQKIIDDILDLSKIEAGKLPIEKNIFRINDLVDDVAQSLEPLALKKGLHIETTYAPSISMEVYSDSSRLRQILTNLLGNAIKFSERGNISIWVKSSENPHDIAIEVRDRGVGITAEAQQQLFRPFSQADNSIGRKFGGTGLGLILSRNIARSLGGDLVLSKSVPGEGSTFLLTFEASLKGRQHIEPAAQEEEEDLERLRPEQEGLRILLVEDMPDNELLVRVYLKAAGFQSDTAVNGFEAIEKALTQDFDLILMDIQMPGLDGLEATRRLRSRHYNKPIVALTAHAMDEEVEKSLAAGCNAHITKPINRHSLLMTIRKLLQESKNPAAR